MAGDQTVNVGRCTLDKTIGMSRSVIPSTAPFRLGIQRLTERFRTLFAQAEARRWRPYSRLFLRDDGGFWSLSHDMRELAAISRQLGIPVADLSRFQYARNQAVFYASRYALLLNDAWERQSHRLATAYFHGRPGSGEPVFDELYAALCRAHPHLHRVQVSHSEMRDLVLSSGIDPQKVFLIPIGVNLSYFHLQTQRSRRETRLRCGIPESAVVVGSFQKDGVGWGEGLEPKLIKGPDVFLKAISLLKRRVPELFVLLTGPARGYMKAGLERLGIPYRHYFVDNYAEIGQFYQSLDVYIVASRQEGGPKAVLESMASGVPLVTTRVGQAMDLVRHGENGWMVEVEDAEGLAHWTEYAIDHRDSLENVIRCARQTAEENSYDAQVPLWREFMRGFVKWEDPGQ